MLSRNRYKWTYAAIDFVAGNAAKFMYKKIFTTTVVETRYTDRALNIQYSIQWLRIGFEQVRTQRLHKNTRKKISFAVSNE